MNDEPPAGGLEDVNQEPCPECGLVYGQNIAYMNEGEHARCKTCNLEITDSDLNPVNAHSNNDEDAVTVENNVTVDLIASAMASAQIPFFSHVEVAHFSGGFKDKAAERRSEDISVKTARKGFERSLLKCFKPNRYEEENTSGAEEGSEESSINGDEPYVTTIYKRELKLGRVSDENISLYPVCRAWILNRILEKYKQLNVNVVVSNVGETAGQSGSPEEVHSLPPPEPLPLDELGNPIKIWIPQPLPKAKEEFFVSSARDDKKAADPVSLFQNHMTRWKAVRQSWKEAGKKNESRYHESFEILGKLFNKSSEDENARQNETGGAAQQEQQLDLPYQEMMSEGQQRENLDLQEQETDGNESQMDEMHEEDGENQGPIEIIIPDVKLEAEEEQEQVAEYDGCDQNMDGQ